MKTSDLGLRVARSYPSYDMCYCPFHSDTHPSAAYYHATANLYCFTCRKTFTVGQIVATTGTSKLSSEEISELIKKGMFGVIIKAFESGSEMSRIIKSFDEIAISYEETTESELEAIAYLQSRKITLKTANKYGLRHNGNGIVFSHHELTVNNYSGYVERLYNPPDKTQRYFKHGKLANVWPIMHTIGKDIKYVFVTEGPFKAMRINQMLTDAGYNDFASITSFGLKSANDVSAFLLFGNSKAIVIGDPDDAGRNWAKSFKIKRNCYPFSFAVPFDEVDDITGIVALRKMVSIVEEKQAIKPFPEFSK